MKEYTPCLVVISSCLDIWCLLSLVIVNVTQRMTSQFMLSAGSHTCHACAKVRVEEKINIYLQIFFFSRLALSLAHF